MIALGPFRMERVIGRGGMGEVWRARHRDGRHVVAVKVLTSQAAQDPFFLSAFRNEVRAVAGLNHPNIASVYDHGRVPTAAESASEGQLRAGSPYLVMEMASGGSLESHLGRLDWQALRLLLLCLLDALAHAHARGVVHRDLKPGNALLAGGWANIKLTDFGLAHPFGGDQPLREDEGAVGTPAYMAPEQFEGSWRDYGPWTDLYGLGCLAHALASGRPPFGPSPQAARAMSSHLMQPAPEIMPRCALPDGFQEWVSALLEKEPSRRFQRAADAAWALRQLEATPDMSSVSPQPPGAADPSPALADTVEMARSPRRAELSGPRTEPPPGAPLLLPADPGLPNGIVTPTRAPPMPATWRRVGGRSAESTKVPMIRGAGLGLFGLRTLGLVGRVADRDLLWETLSRVRRVGRARAVVLMGQPGCGRSRLADWLCERAHELGVARVFHGVMTPSDSGADAVAAMIGRALHVRGLAGPELSRRLRATLRHEGLDRAEIDALAALLAPGPAESDPTLGMDRFGVARRFLERASRDRPVLVVLEDVHWGRGAIDFATNVLESQVRSPAPILLVLTACDPALVERPAEAEAIKELLARPDTRGHEIGPMSPEEFQELLRVQLGLSPTLAARVEHRAAGNPRFAVELVSDWIQRGRLDHGEGGLTLEGADDLELPSDLLTAWRARVDRALEGRPQAEREALQLAAVLGMEVDGAEWRAACGALGIAPPWELLETLLTWRLVRCEPTGPWTGWSFTSSLLREALARDARDAGTLPRLHAAAAEVLRGLSSRPTHASVALTERLGRHLVEAGALSEALGLLLQAAEARYNAGELARCTAILDERDRAVRLLGLTEADLRVAEGWILQCRCATEQGKTDLASALAARADEAAARNGWLALRASALKCCAEIARRLGDSHEAVVLMEEARRFARASGSRGLLASCRVARADVMLSHGLSDEAAHDYAQASRELEEEGDALGAASCWVGLGRVAARQRAVGPALEHAERARSVFIELGARAREADALTLIGQIAWQRGDLSAAQRAWEEARGALEALQSREAPIVEARLALVEIGRGRFSEARQILESCRQRLERAGMRKRSAPLRVWLLPCCAGEGDWAGFDVHLKAAGDLLQETGYVDVDVARLATWAGDLSLAGGQERRARLAWDLGLEQWLVLGWEDEIIAVQKLLGAGPGPAHGGPL